MTVLTSETVFKVDGACNSLSFDTIEPPSLARYKKFIVDFSSERKIGESYFNYKLLWITILEETKAEKASFSFIFRLFLLIYDEDITIDAQINSSSFFIVHVQRTNVSWSFRIRLYYRTIFRFPNFIQIAVVSNRKMVFPIRISSSILRFVSTRRCENNRN